MKKIIKLTESELVKIVNEVVMNIQQINAYEEPFNPFVYKVYSKEDIPSFEQTFKHSFELSKYMHFPLVVIGFETRVPVLIGDDRGPKKNQYEIEDVKIYVPFMYLQTSEKSSGYWRSITPVRVTKSKIPPHIIKEIAFNLMGKDVKEMSAILSRNPYNGDRKAEINSFENVFNKLTELLDPHTPQNIEFPKKVEYGDFEDVD